MPGKFHYRNQSQRFDLYTFYALLTKCKIVELLDKNGYSPFDSDSMNDSVLDYAAQLYKDISDNGILSYFDSDNFRHDSDGAGNNTWGSITRNSATAKVYESLRKWLYVQSNNGGINNDSDTITSGFTRKYYTVPVSDSDGSLRHVNIYSFIKSHFNRWISYDTYERYKLVSRVYDVMRDDSDISYKFAHQFLRAVEEDSDLARRKVEMYSNRLQSDSDIRQEIVKTAITALTGLTPGGDSDSARALVEVVSAVLETDSEIRNEFGDHLMTSLSNDSDQQTELGDIISSAEAPHMQVDILRARQVLPMDGDNTGNIGTVNRNYSYQNFTTLRTDSTKSYKLAEDGDGKEVGGIVFGNDSDVTLDTDSDLRVVLPDVENLLLHGLVHMNFDSDRFVREVTDSRDAWMIDSEKVNDILRETHVKPEGAFPIGQRGDIYAIIDAPDSEYTRDFSDSDLPDLFGPEGNITGSEGTVGYFGLTSDGFGNTGLTGVYAPSLNLTADTAPGGNSSNVFKEGNTIYPGGMSGEFEISYKIAGFGFTGFSMFPTSASAEASRTYLGTVSGTRVNAKSMTGYFYAQARLDNIQNSSSSAGSPYGGYRNQHFSGNITLSSYHGGAVGGDGGTVVVPGLTGGTFDSAYPTIVHQGRDSEGYWYIAVTGYDSTLSAMRRSPNYYFDGGSATNATLKTHDELVALGRSAPHYARYGHTITDGLQLGYGNYDFYPVSQFRDITVTGLQVTDTIINNTNYMETKKLVFTSDKVVDTSQELSRALGDVVTKATVFNTWYRFSHGNNFNYPNIASEANSGWAYDAGTDTIYTTINSSSYAGFVSPDTYDDFTFKATLNAPYSAYPNSDDDSIIMIVGFVTEGVKGQAGYREHTLSFVRTAGGLPYSWGLFYNYLQPDSRFLVDGSNFGSASTGIVFNTSNTGPPHWTDFANGSRVEIRRKGDSIVAYCSQMNTTTIDSDTEISWDLSSDSDTLKFRGPVSYGYGAYSQQGSYWTSIFFNPDEGSYLHNLTPNTEYTSSSGGNVYEYDIDNAVWNMDSDLTVDNTAGERLLHNEDTHKTFYNNPETDTAVQIMSARKFSDVIHLPALSSEPDSDMLGRMGLQPGTIARADGVNWDPKSKGGSTPYFVFYNGSAWYEMDTS